MWLTSEKERERGGGVEAVARGLTEFLFFFPFSFYLINKKTSAKYTLLICTRQN